MAGLVLRDVADVVNASLVQIGYKLLIANIYDGSAAAQKALTVYGQVRDDLLRQDDWDFAKGDVALVLLKSAPANMTYLTPWTDQYPPLPWQFEYEYPDDCLKVRAVKPTPIFIFNPNPQPNVLQLENDNSFSPARKVILCNVPDAILTYTRQVTNPSTWDAGFTTALVDKLGERLAPALTEMGAAQMSAAQASRDTRTAVMERG